MEVKENGPNSFWEELLANPEGFDPSPYIMIVFAFDF